MAAAWPVGLTFAGAEARIMVSWATGGVRPLGWDVSREAVAAPVMERETMFSRPPDDTDWYVLYAEREERKERTRKWRLLAYLLALSLVLIGAGAGYVYVRAHPDKIPKWAEFLKPGRRRAEQPPGPIRAMPLDPVVVESLIEGQIKFSQLDRNGFVTSITHWLLELPQDIAAAEGDPARKGFLVRRPDPTEPGKGTVERYCLRNKGTGDKYEFQDVPVHKLEGSAEWIITDEGHSQIKKKLQAKLRVPLSRGH